ncbi:glycosyltransferase [candidate division KSB1 bacterium]|nr:glycosyltransferase [candidate division KSB1 bacterium]
MNVWLMILLSITCLIYTAWIVSLFLGLTRLKTGRDQNLHQVSVIIPAKNEAGNIGACLNSIVSQDYPTAKMEIIVVDDHSDDGTAGIVEKIAERDPRIRLMRSGDIPTEQASKKHALEAGIRNCRGDLIFTTDADCIASKGWLKAMVAHFEPHIGVVSGPVLFEERPSILSKFQALEFIGLIAAGAGSIGMGRPIIANGANLAYRKAAFQEVNGFEGQRHLVSGDDDLLLQKIAQQTTWRVAFAIDYEAAITTQPAKNPGSFLNQRARWASKGVHYSDVSLVFLLSATYIFYVLLLFGLPVTLFIGKNFTIPLLCLFVKFMVDFMVVQKGCALFRKTRLLVWFPIAEVLQLPYIVYAGITGFFGFFKWK